MLPPAVNPSSSAIVRNWRDWLHDNVQVLFGSTPTYPTIGRVWEVIERYRVRSLFLFRTFPAIICSEASRGSGSFVDTLASSRISSALAAQCM